MGFASVADTIALETEMPWAERDVPKTLYQMLSQTRDKVPLGKAVTFQLLSGPTDKAETLNWTQLHEKTCQAANLFRSLGIGEGDVVACVLPYCY